MEIFIQRYKICTENCQILVEFSGSIEIWSTHVSVSGICCCLSKIWNFFAPIFLPMLLLYKTASADILCCHLPDLCFFSSGEHLHQFWFFVHFCFQVRIGSDGQARCILWPISMTTQKFSVHLLKEKPN